MTDIPFVMSHDDALRTVFIGPWTNGTTLTINWVSHSTSTGCSWPQYTIGVDSRTYAGGSHDYGETNYSVAVAGGSWSATLVADADYITVAWFVDAFRCGGWVYEVTVDGGGTPGIPGGYCSFGTRVKPDTPGIVYLVPSLINAIIGALTENVWWSIAGVFAGNALDVGALCASLPPATPDITADDVINMVSVADPMAHATAWAKGWQWVQAASWPYFCECTPGTPTPRVPPPPSPESLPPPQPLLPVVCDDAALCRTLEAIQRQLDAVSIQVQLANRDLTLIQRQSVPFAYVSGALHTGLTGAGTFDVQGILGLSVDTTAKPGWLSSDMAPVQSWFKLGEISWGTADGWMARRIITHDPHLFLDIDGSITRVGYQLEPGVTSNIRELVREP